VVWLPEEKTADQVARRSYEHLHSGQTHGVCAVPTIILQKKIQKNVETLTLSGKLNATSENLSFLL